MRTFVPALAGLAALALAGGSLASVAEAATWPWQKRPAPVEQATPAAGEVVITATPADATDRLARAEAKIRELTGRIEELTFQLNQIEEFLNRVQADNEFRFQELEGRVGEAAAVPAPIPAPVASAPRAAPPVPATASAPPPAASAAPPPAAPANSDPLGRLVIDAPGAGQPMDLGAVARVAAPPAAPPVAPAGDLRGSAVVASLGSPAADYERAYGSILSGDYEMAEASFRGFLAAYPGDERAPDAQYWLGESLFARGLYRDAADEFLSGYKNYPKSGKAADTLLKLGLSLAGLGERDAACSTYSEVLKKYPKASNSLRQRVANEQALASC